MTVLHVWAAVLAEDGPGPFRHATVEEEYPAHGPKDPFDDGDLYDVA